MKFTVTSFLIFVTPFLMGQNLEKIGKKDMVKINGGIAFNTLFYNGNRSATTRDPFSWYASGNLNVSILDVNIPLTYSYSNNKSTFTRPFNQFALTPHYKWVKAYIGYSGLNFSAYTYAGHVLFGGGVELRPKNFTIAGVYGRLNKATNYFNTDGNANALPSFERWGYAGKLKYEKNSSGIGFTFLHAYDLINSLNDLPSTATLKPENNTAISIDGRVQLFKQLSLDAEIGFSGINANTANALSNEGKTWYLPGVKQTEYYKQFKAFKANANYLVKGYTLSLGYERVDPDYRTLGAYYFINDIENIVAGLAGSLLKSKVNFSIQSGIQRNNLNDQKKNTDRRLILSLNTGINWTQQLSSNISLSNFSNYTKNRLQVVPGLIINPLDTLNFYQVNRQIQIGTNYSFDAKLKLNTISVTYANQKANNGASSSNQNYILTSSDNKAATIVQSINTNYNRKLMAIKSSVSFGLSYNTTRSEINKQWFIGPTAAFGTALLNNQIRLSYSTAYSLTKQNDVAGNPLWNQRLQTAWAPKANKKSLFSPSCSLFAGYTKTFGAAKNNTKLVSEFNAGINAALNF
jgi:hypothetical protein